MFDREEICDDRWKKVGQKWSVVLGNEWKTRFENQEEINRHLARQIILLERNIEQAKEEQKMGKPDGPWPTWNDMVSFHSAKTRAAKADPNEVWQCAFSCCSWKK